MSGRDRKIIRHKEWRREAKRARRRKIRKQWAQERDGTLHQGTDDKGWIQEQSSIELFEIEQIEKANMEENIKWMNAEKVAMEQWRKLLEHQKMLEQKQLEQAAKLKLEWKLEKERKRKDEERLKEIEEENKRKQKIFMAHLEQFLTGDSIEPPSELLEARETRPTMPPCPFFTKTSCCRFSEQCSRNHKYPGISKVLLATNFYSHFGMDNASFSEYDTDVMLEYEESDTYREFKDFFNDVVPEFEKFGRIIQFKVCNNYEKHLRGNVYVEFAELRCAVAAYRSLHSRWYGGKQLSLQFCIISSWKNAICGLQSRKKCPKGRACNFLHVFRNPNNVYNSLNQESERSRRTPPQSWRWSESPELEILRRRPRSRSKERRRSTSRKRRREHKRDNHSPSDKDRGKRERHCSQSNKRNSERRKDRRSPG